ncbi:MAG: transposase [Zavarzinella sp.]
MIYHIIWTTYGTWLHGDERGSLKKGIPIIQPPDPSVVEAMRTKMTAEKVLLSKSQQLIVTDTIVEVCKWKQWQLFALAVVVNHVHIVLASDKEGKQTHNQLKAWCSRRLTETLTEHNIKQGFEQPKKWFTERGYIRIIENETYLEEAVKYVEAQKMPEV